MPASDFIELYAHEIAMLNQKIKILTQKYEAISNEVTMCTTTTSFSFIRKINQYLIISGRRNEGSKFSTTNYIYEMDGTCPKSPTIEWNVRNGFDFKNLLIEQTRKCFKNLLNCRLLAENERLNAIVGSLRSKLKMSLEEKAESLRNLGQEKNAATKKSKEMVSWFITSNV